MYILNFLNREYINCKTKQIVWLQVMVKKNIHYLILYVVTKHYHLVITSDGIQGSDEHIRISFMLWFCDSYRVNWFCDYIRLVVMYYMYYTFGFVILMSDTERLTFLDI